MTVESLLARNRAWSSRMCCGDADFFARLARQQKPAYLWIGCSDSRVPSNQILDLAPGEVFTHRNIANVVASSDLNCLSVIQFAVDILKVRHIMVVGHYGCSGIRAAVEGLRLGLVDNWLGHVEAVHAKHQRTLMALPAADWVDRLCELNVAEQFHNVCQTHTVRDAWARGQPLSVHGWVYGLQDGLLSELGLSASNSPAADNAYQAALEDMATPHFKARQPLAGDERFEDI
ncbi:carbonate dehydratase [Polaromonas hydrogenivorans]|uniref:Carbonic anhydrase 2 n=1 Tax=Polaromonas hydrogenivorans TaxID=335476 RepID=A0AAU7M051_9BURK